MLRWLLQQEGNLSPLAVAVFGQLCLKVLPVTCPLAHHLALKSGVCEGENP